MKVIYHHRTLADGAEGIHIREMISAFTALGHDVILRGPSTGSSSHGKFSLIKKIVNGPFYEIMELFYNIAGFISMTRAIRKYKPDVIYDRYMIYNFSIVMVAKIFKIPVITEINAPLAYERRIEPDEKLFFPKVADFIEKWIARKSTVTVVVSTPLKEYFRVKKNISTDQFMVLPNGVNTSKFNIKHKNTALRQKLRIHSREKIVGFTGILRPWHGINILLEAILILKKTMRDVKLLLVGDGPELYAIHDMINKMKLKKNVIITGRVPHSNIPQYIDLFDVAVSPKTTFYASPMKIPEYMALKKCIIAPNTPNIRDLLDNDKTGLLFTPEDPSSLSKLLEKALTDTSFRKRIALNAHIKAMHSMSWNNIAERVLTFTRDRIHE